MRLVTRPARAVLAACLVALAALAGAETAAADGGLRPGAVFAQTNDALANEVVAYRRSADGTLSDPRTVPTGGQGSGTVEDSANGLVLANRSGDTSPNNLNGPARFLFVTNAGSDSISVFRVEPQGLERVEVESSNGRRPRFGDLNHHERA